MFLGLVVLITVGLMRVVAEGDIYLFQLHTGPFHLAKLIGGVKTILAAVLAPLMTVYSVLSLDVSTYMAPAVLNSLKMRDDARTSRRMFHTIVLLSILVTILVSIVAILYIAYDLDANRAHSLYFNARPQGLLDQIQRLASGVSGTTIGVGQVHLGGITRWNWLFYVFGGVWVILSVLLRRRLFWWLHPIGLAMMANPYMSRLWLSLFIGWLCKRWAVTYGGRHNVRYPPTAFHWNHLWPADGVLRLDADRGATRT